VINSPPERRSAPRISPKGSVSLRTASQRINGRLDNVSYGGVRITALGPIAIEVGDEAAMALRLDGISSAWLDLGARVVRVAGATIALELQRVTEGFMDMMTASMYAARTNGRRMTVVLVDASLERRMRMAEAFRSAGCLVTTVTTPLEAIVRLGELEFEPDVIAISDSRCANAEDLRRFAAHAHPRAKLVRIGEQLASSASREYWLSAAHYGRELVANIRLMLCA
jgi:hypothetical protein